MSDLLGRLRENIVATAFEDRRITDGALAERLIRERFDASDEIERLRAALTDARQALTNITVARTVEEAQTISRVAIGILNQQRTPSKEG